MRRPIVETGSQLSCKPRPPRTGNLLRRDDTRPMPAFRGAEAYEQGRNPPNFR